MFHMEFDYRELSDYAQQVGARVDQIPFALSLALNRAADVTRNVLIKQTWPQHVHARNPSFIAASLTTREARASKSSLAVEIYDRLDRGNLQKQAKGGTRTPRGGSNLAIPASTVTRTQRGVPRALKPANLKNSFKAKNMLFVRDSRGRAKLVYTLKHQTPIPKRVPFYEDFTTSMQRELTRTIPMAVARAMSTARKL